MTVADIVIPPGPAPAHAPDAIFPSAGPLDVAGGLASGLNLGRNLARRAATSASSCAADNTIGLSKKGLKYLGRHTNDFRQFDPNFSLDNQIALGRRIASNPQNLVNSRNGSQGFESIVNIGGTNVRVRSVINSSGNLRNVFPVTR